MPRIGLAWQAGDWTAGESPTITLPLVVKDCADEQSALIFLLENVSSEYLLADGSVLYLKSAKITGRNSDTIWNGQANYGPQNTQSQGESPTLKYRFRTGGGTEHITLARAQANYPPLSAPDPKNGINADKDGIKGVDRFVPAFEWEEPWPVLTSSLTAAYLKTLADMTPSVNNASFRTFDAGEVLFKFAEGGAEFGKKFSEITFHFARSKNKTNFLVGTITVSRKDGWELMEVRSETTVSNNVTLATPKSVHIDTIYELADFSRLGIGTS